MAANAIEGDGIALAALAALMQSALDGLLAADPAFVAEAELAELGQHGPPAEEVAMLAAADLRWREGERNLPRAPPRRRRHVGLWRGAKRGSQEHMVYVRTAKRARKVERDAPEVQHKSDLVARMWNSQRLRVGDTIVTDDRATGSQQAHANAWATSGVLRTAFGSVGKGCIASSGVDGTKNTLDCISGVAAAAVLCQIEKVEAHLVSLQEGGSESHIVGRYYDATPMRLSFQRPELRQLLMPLARYLLKDEISGRWKTVPFEVYSKVHPHSKLKCGVLEVFAQQATITSTNADGLWVQRELKVPPCILAHANASCIHAACERVPGLNLESVKQLCAKSKAVFLNDGPDNAKANTRKKQFVAKELRHVDNLLMNHTGCGAHLLHRVIVTALPESDIVGDVHAVAFTCSQVRHQARLQRVLWDVVEGMEISFMPPDPDCLARNKLIASRTLCRRIDVTTGALVDGATIFSMPAHDEKRARVDKLLMMLNGDWTQDRLRHHCVPGVCCCSSEDETRSNTFAALLENGATLGTDSNLPSKNRWGTTTATAAEVAAFVMCHAVLPQILRRAFPYSAIAAAPLAADADEEEAHRERIRSKARRACCVTKEPLRRCQVSLVAWVTSPIDELFAKMQYLDERGNALLDLVRSGGPLTVCQQKATAMLQPQSELHPFMSHFKDIAALPGCARKILASMVAQLWLRFAAYEQFPLRLALLAHPASTDAEKCSIANEVFSSPLCCMDIDFTHKVRRLFETADQLLSDQAFLRGLRLWAAQTKSTNMHLERQLAQVKRSVCQVGKTAPDAERLVSLGFLGQMLASHKCHGGEDCRVHTRAQLLRQGAPLRAGAKHRAKSRPASGFILLQSKATEAAKLECSCAGRLLSNAALAELRGGARAQWTQMSAAEKRRWTEKSRCVWLTRSRREEESAELNAAQELLRETRLSHHFWGLGSLKWPLSPENLERAIRRALNLAPADPLPGHRRYCESLRKDWLGGILVDDAEAIPSQTVVTTRLPCWQAHPGLRRTADACCWEEALALYSHLQEYFFQFGQLGEFYKVLATFAEGPDVRFDAIFAYKRLARPQVALYLVCEVGGGDPLKLQVALEAAKTANVLSTGALVKELFRGHEGAERPLVRSLSVARHVVEDRRAEVLVVGEEQLTDLIVPDGPAAAPEPAAAAPEAPAAAARAGTVIGHWSRIMDAFLQGLALSFNASMQGRDAPADCEGLVPATLGPIARALEQHFLEGESGSSTDAESEDTVPEAESVVLSGGRAKRALPPLVVGSAAASSQPASAGGEAVAEAPVAPAVPVAPAPAEPAAEALQHHPRERRSEDWHGFSLAPVYRRTQEGKVQIGWGANCHCHVNATDGPNAPKCQKQITYGTGSSEISDAECQRLAKCWLVLGMGLPMTDTCRSDHVGIRIRKEALTDWTEGRLESLVAAVR